MESKSYTITKNTIVDLSNLHAMVVDSSYLIQNTSQREISLAVKNNVPNSVTDVVLPASSFYNYTHKADVSLYAYSKNNDQTVGISDFFLSNGGGSSSDLLLENSDGENNAVLLESAGSRKISALPEKTSISDNDFFVTAESSTNSKISNATIKKQTEDIAEEKATVTSKAVHEAGNEIELTLPESDYAASFLYDPEKTFGNGYGKNNTITYFSIYKDEVIVLDPDQAKAFFIHERQNTTHGWLAIHVTVLKKLFPLLKDDANSVRISPNNVNVALGKFNSTAPAGENQWNLGARAVHEDEDPNNPTPSTWIKEDGSPTTNKSEAAKATFSSGKCLLPEGKTEAQRGTLMLTDPNNVLKSRGDDAVGAEIELIENLNGVGVSGENEGGVVVFTADDSSPWFMLKCTAGGGTFNDHKVFMVFQTNADVLGAVFRFALDLDIVKGLLNENRDNRILALENQVNPSELQLKDEATGNTVTLGVNDRRLVVTDTTIGSNAEINLGGITVDPGFLFPGDMYINMYGNWTSPAKANGHNNGGFISTEYIDSPGQWFDISRIVSDTTFVPQGFGLIDESIVNGNAPSGIQLWSGAAPGGSNFMGAFYYGCYSWTYGHNNADTPGGKGATLTAQISVADQKKLALARFSSVETGRVSYTHIRIGIDTDLKLKIQWFLPQEAIDDGTVSGGTPGWKTIFRTSGLSDAGHKYRFKWSAYIGGAELASLPIVTGVPSTDQRFAASGKAYYIVQNIDVADKDAADLILAEATNAEGTKITIAKYAQPHTFVASTVYDEVAYTQANVAAKSPLFVTYDIDTQENIEQTMSAVSAFQELRHDVCRKVLDRVIAYYLVKNLSAADEQTVLQTFADAQNYAEGGYLKSTLDAILKISATDLIPQVLLDELQEELRKGLRMFPR